MHGPQRKTQVHRKKDDGRQPEAEGNEGVDTIGKKLRRMEEKKRITIHWVKGERRWKAADQHSRSLATPRVAGITAGIVILVNENISISSKLQFYNVPYAYCTIISAKDYLCYGNNAWPY